MSKTRIMSPEQTGRTITRLAYQLVERNSGAGNLEMIGIRSRGAALAKAIAREIEKIEDRTFEVDELDVARFRDDRDPGAAGEDHSTVNRDLTDKDVILVDDVLFTGRTARAALDAIVRYGRPRSIQLAVLIDRGYREYPIQPDFVGRLIQTKHKERVVVDVGERFTVFVEE